MLFTQSTPGFIPGSQSIAELILQRCHEYTSQTPALLVDTPRLRLLKLIEVGLNGEQLDNLLKSAPTRMMQTLEVIMTLYPPLRLSGATLSAFSLTSLSLSNNGITDFAFLPSLEPSRLAKSESVVRLDLSGNQIQTLSDWRRLQPLLSAILYRDRQSG
uniref:Leucine-rich repeat domain-containing protein n=1 Tax=Macrostomum lignano TaxID=282301 RepID=A0A1I8IDJ3_9PLAT